MEERQRLPRRREELTEEGELPLERSKHGHRSHHQTTDCNARESGTCPDAAGHQTRQDQQREQQAKTPAPAGVTAQKVAAPAAVEDGHATPPRRCCRSGHTRQDSRCSQGRGARQAHEELGKLLQKTDGRAAMDTLPEQEGRPPLLQATGD